MKSLKKLGKVRK